MAEKTTGKPGRAPAPGMPPRPPEGAGREEQAAALAALAARMQAARAAARRHAILARSGEGRGEPGFCADGLRQFLARHGLGGYDSWRPARAQAEEAPPEPPADNPAHLTDEGLAAITALRFAQAETRLAAIRADALAARRDGHTTLARVRAMARDAGLAAPRRRTRHTASVRVEWSGKALDDQQLAEAVRAALEGAGGAEAGASVLRASADTDWV